MSKEIINLLKDMTQLKCDLSAGANKAIHRERDIDFDGLLAKIDRLQNELTKQAMPTLSSLTRETVLDVRWARCKHADPSLCVVVWEKLQATEAIIEHVKCEYRLLPEVQKWFRRETQPRPLATKGMPDIAITPMRIMK